MRTASRIFSAGTLLLMAATVCAGQNNLALASSSATNATAAATNSDSEGPAPSHEPISHESIYARRTWEYGPFVDFGVGTGDRSDYKFFNAGLHAGRVLFSPAGPGIVRGQFEYAGELIPFWQAYTPAPHLQPVTYVLDGVTYHGLAPVGGGTFTGISITPIILRWNLNGMASKRVLPWIQGAGGLIWTNHKFPPDYLVAPGQPGGTSVFNFTPQFGIGVHYFFRPRRSVDFSANAVHISSASLGDHNPGVNASVQFQLGYTWWKK